MDVVKDHSFVHGAKNPSYASTWDGTQDPYAWNGWQESAWNPKPKKPRPRSKSQHQQKQQPAPPNPAGKGRGQGKGKGKGGKQKSPTEPVWTAPSAPSQVPVAPAAPEPSADQQLLKTLVHALKQNPQSLSPELQQIVQEASLKTTQHSTNQMFGAVKGYGKAQQNLQQAVSARQILHTAWQDFILEAVNRWQQYSQEFTEEDQKLAKQIQTAQEALAHSKKLLASSKTAAGVKTEEAEVVDSSDTEPMDTTDKTVQEGMEAVGKLLETLKTKASDFVAADQKDAKRRRKEFTKEQQLAAEAAGDTADASSQPFVAAVK